jgi:cytochrome c-type biogenesis protein CcmE
MKPKHARLLFLLCCALAMGFATLLILRSFRDNMIFFYTPGELAEKMREPGFDASRPLRIGGLVKKHSVENLKTGGVRFTVTDLKNDLPVTYKGLVPSLFREGQGVVAQGKLTPGGTLDADTILAKHDETYMPRQVVDALKKSGRWQECGNAQ